MAKKAAGKPAGKHMMPGGHMMSDKEMMGDMRAGKMPVKGMPMKKKGK